MSKLKFVSFLTIFLSIIGIQGSFSQNDCHTAHEILYSDSVDVFHYGIHLNEINLTQKTIKGYTDVSLKARVNGLVSIQLELAVLQVDSVFCDGNPCSGFVHSGQKLSIPLIQSLSAGDSLAIRVYYHGSTFVDPSGWGGFHFAGNYAFNLGVGFDAIPHNLGKAWFPCVDDFRDRALYDVYLTVPEGMAGISGGELIGVNSSANNTNTWHWKTRYTLPTYLISATIGNYSLVADTFAGQEGTIPITYYCRPSDTSRVSNTFINLKDILQVFEEHFGPYPLERVGYSATAEGAMEHAANISYPYSGWNGNTSFEWWYAHELSHMWFGGMVTCASAEDMWLNEGWAVWCESFFMEKLYGQDVAMEYLRLKLKNVILQCHIEDGGYYAVYGIPQTITYGKTVYEKGCQVTHTLRHYLGDSLFFRGIKAYLQAYAYSPASSCEMRDFLSAFTGVDLNDFFEAWVFSPGFYNFTVGHWGAQPAVNGYDVNVSVKQKLRNAPQYANSNRVELTFVGASMETFTDTIQFSGAVGEKTFHVPFKPVDVITDRYEKISDAAISHESFIHNTGELDFTDTYSKVITSEITDSAWVRITHNWAAPDTIKTAIPGVRISDSRFWKVEGNFPASFKAKGKFFYNKSNLDKTLITSTNDSVIILYRKDDLSEWKGTGFSRIGSATIGYLTTDSLSRGEYAIAVLDKTYGFQDNKAVKGMGMQIYPNPAHGQCTIQIENTKEAILSIFDPAGKKLDELMFKAGKHSINWAHPTLSKGVYVFRLTSERGNDQISKKLILN